MLPFVIALLISQTTATFPCDGVQYTYSDISVFSPAGVCTTSSDGGSTMYLCASPNIINVAQYYSVSNCSGSPDGLVPVTSSFELLNITEYTIICCSGNQCDYALDAEYDTANCSEDKSEAVSWDQSIWTIDACVGIYYFAMYTYTSCQPGVANYDFYFTNGTTCSGAPNVLTKSSGCDDGDTNDQTVVTCGTAINTCSDSNTTSRPTTSEQTTSEQTTSEQTTSEQTTSEQTTSGPMESEPTYILNSVVVLNKWWSNFCVVMVVILGMNMNE